MSFDEFYQVVLSRHLSIAMNPTTTLTRENFRKAMNVAFDAGFDSGAVGHKKLSDAIPDFLIDMMSGKKR